MTALWAIWLSATVALAEDPAPPPPHTAPLKIGPGMNAVGLNLRACNSWSRISPAATLLTPT